MLRMRSYLIRSQLNLSVRRLQGSLTCHRSDVFFAVIV